MTNHLQIQLFQSEKNLTVYGTNKAYIKKREKGGQVSQACSEDRLEAAMDYDSALLHVFLFRDPRVR